MEAHILPAEQPFRDHMRETGNKWVTPPLIEDLKEKARQEGLWNLFVPLAQRYAKQSGLCRWPR